MKNMKSPVLALMFSLYAFSSATAAPISFNRRDNRERPENHDQQNKISGSDNSWWNWAGWLGQDDERRNYKSTDYESQHINGVDFNRERNNVPDQCEKLPIDNHEWFLIFGGAIIGITVIRKKIKPENVRLSGN